MRRRSAGVTPGDEVMTDARPVCEVDPERVIALLEPLILEARRRRFEEVIGNRLASVTVILDAPHDPHNGAAVVRSCEAFGVHTLHVVESRERFLVARSVARSAEKWAQLRCHTAAREAIAAVAGFELVAARADGDLLPQDLASIPKLALVLGNERDGVGPELASACTRSVRVPMRGFVESLNVSVTAAILLAAATTGRPGDLHPDDRRRLYARCLRTSVAHADEILRAGELPTASVRGALRY
jgi:tRNA (guanosine-2'-O-)-methyltransferase